MIKMDLLDRSDSKYEEISLLIPGHFPLIYKRPVRMQQVTLTPYYGTCSCTLFRNRAKLYPKGDLRRVCKHLYQFYKTNAADYFDELSMIILDLQFWFFGDNQTKLLSDGNNYILSDINENVRYEIFFAGKWCHRQL